MNSSPAGTGRSKFAAVHEEARKMRDEQAKKRQRAIEERLLQKQIQLEKRKVSQ